ncbi:hypothetical protein L6452_36635 [Arctium lappa]|uniref:Uncharacterized protein n=1 Tax=Arctium lappa TaxID=4217 RepID=A0ACB8Y950_ARCLA|nr:hypothetical protein L6452_36635 [Arctium lappa]
MLSMLYREIHPLFPPSFFFLFAKALSSKRKGWMMMGSQGQKRKKNIHAQDCGIVVALCMIHLKWLQFIIS